MPQANAQLLERFYTAFAALDATTMAACYAEDARFDDEVFALAGRAQVAGMWRMLCDSARQQGADVWSLRFEGVAADDCQGSSRWQARYRFSATGRLVHNAIASRFEFRDGLIWRQRDRFSFWRWSRQALGLPGWLLGGTSWLQDRVRAQAAAKLRAFLAEQG